MGNQCVAATDRESCELGGGDVQEGKTCGGGNTCDAVPGGQKLTWWDRCTPRSCGGTAVTTLAELIACVGQRADEVVDGMLCYQFPQANWSCPSSPSAAFLD
jgi:hypothetical protein